MYNKLKRLLKSTLVNLKRCIDICPIILAMTFLITIAFACITIDEIKNSLNEKPENYKFQHSKFCHIIVLYLLVFEILVIVYIGLSWSVAVNLALEVCKKEEVTKFVKLYLLLEVILQNDLLIFFSTFVSILAMLLLWEKWSILKESIFTVNAYLFVFLNICYISDGVRGGRGLVICDIVIYDSNSCLILLLLCVLTLTPLCVWGFNIQKKKCLFLIYCGFIVLTILLFLFKNFS